MNTPVKITTLEVENLKRIKAFCGTFAESGLTVIGGNNGQGKTSVLDSISYLLGGEKYRPTNIKHEGGTSDPALRVTLSNGLIVERKGKASALKVTDPSGNKSGQTLLNAFVHGFALDLPRFLNSTEKQKCETLLQVIGVGDQIAELDAQEARIYEERRVQGRIAEQKRKYADGLPEYANAPDEVKPVSVLVAQQQEIADQNRANERFREKGGELQRIAETRRREVADCRDEIERIKAKLKEAEQELESAVDRSALAHTAIEKHAEESAKLIDKPTDEIQRQIDGIEELNAKARANIEKAKANKEAFAEEEKHAELERDIEKVRNDRTKLLEGAKLPLPGLSVDGGAITYDGKHWDCMSSSEQMKVGAAIAAELNPKCGFVLLDRLETMDRRSMEEFAQWLESRGLQAIATRVSTGEECSIIIEDGMVSSLNTTSK